jgi:hypothetical protein
MRRHVLTAATILSFMVCVVLIILWGLTYSLYDCRYQIPVGSDFHVAASAGAIWLYNGPEPYRGSIIPLTDDQGNRILRNVGYDLPGIYLRYFRWPADMMFMLCVWIVYPIVLTGLLPYIRFFRWLDRRLTYRAVCPVCNKRISRLGFLRTRRKCRGCGAKLRQDAKWDWVRGGISVGLLCWCIILAFTLWFSWLALGLTVLLFVSAGLLFPYRIKYDVDQ